MHALPKVRCKRSNFLEGDFCPHQNLLQILLLAPFSLEGVRNDTRPTFRGGFCLSLKVSHVVVLADDGADPVHQNDFKLYTLPKLMLKVLEIGCKFTISSFLPLCHTKKR